MIHRGTYGCLHIARNYEDAMADIKQAGLLFPILLEALDSVMYRRGASLKLARSSLAICMKSQTTSLEQQEFCRKLLSGTTPLYGRIKNRKKLALDFPARKKVNPSILVGIYIANRQKLAQRRLLKCLHTAGKQNRNSSYAQRAPFCCLGHIFFNR